MCSSKGSVKTEMTETKRTLKNLIRKPIRAIISTFHHDKKDDKQIKIESKDDETKVADTKPAEDKKQKDSIDTLLESINQLKLEKDEEEDEFKNFSYKLVKDERNDSVSSKDSGFFDDEKCKEDDLPSTEDKENKTKKKKTVYLIRKPERHTVCKPPTNHPYPQINQINSNIFSGGRVIVNDNQNEEFPTFIDIPTSTANHDSNIDMDLALEMIREDTNILSEFTEIRQQDFNYVQDVRQFLDIPESAEVNAIEEFHTNVGYQDLPEDLDYDIFQRHFLTPPLSNESHASMRDSPSPYHALSVSTSASPQSQRWSPGLPQSYEKWQDIPAYDSSSIPPSEVSSIPAETDVEKPGKSLTMKQFKDRQNALAEEFSKYDCCKKNRGSCRQIFKDCFAKLNEEERQNLCLRAAKLDLKGVYGVMHHILINLSVSDDKQDLLYALFGLMCDRVQAQKPTLFLKNFGLQLLQAAALRCPGHPVLTRRLVECINMALKTDEAKNNDLYFIGPLFNECDARNDTLLSACVSGGDEYADVLAELTKADVMLFDVEHQNKDGYTALHMACVAHGQKAKCLRTVHILLEHAKADILKFDRKAGETPLHLAVNSVTCDLDLVMTIFKHVERKLWKRMAHYLNRSSVTPLEYARLATRSSSRQNYPHEVLNFLKRCR